MRDKKILIEWFEDIRLLQCYLYMNEENFVDIKNSIGVPIRIRLTEKCCYTAQNLNFDFAPVHSKEIGEIENLLSIISQIKEQPAVDFPHRFGNRWEEIKDITLLNLLIN